MSRENSLKKLENSWRPCTKCAIGKWAFRHVFYRGDPWAKIVLIGEGPGRSEDAVGLPFVGTAGKLLDLACAEAGKLPGDLFFTNLVCCRPTDKDGGPNRAPEMVEVSNCRDRLQETLQILQPRVIIWLGKVPQEYAAWYSQFTAMHFFLPHPAWLARQGGSKSAQWPGYVAKLKEAFHYA